MTWLGAFIVGALTCLVVGALVWWLPIGALALIGVICMLYAFYDLVLCGLRLATVAYVNYCNAKRNS